MSKFDVIDDKVSVKILTELVEDRMEDEETPKKVLKFLLEREGKKVTKRHANQLSTMLSKCVFLSKEYGTTHLSWGDDSFLVAHGDVNVHIPGDEALKRQNTHLLSGREERNIVRRKILEDKNKLCRVAHAIINYRAACVEIEESLEMGDYDQNPDRYLMEKLVIPEKRR